jgi:hypothetical protein
MADLGAALRLLELAAAELRAYSAVRSPTSPGDSREPSVVSARFITIELAASLTGFTKRAIESKIHRGDWLEGRHWVKRGGRILIDMQGYERWAEGH